MRALYLPPTISAFETTSRISSSSSCESEIVAALAASSTPSARVYAHLVSSSRARKKEGKDRTEPGIGMIPSHCARFHASASCVDVMPFFSASEVSLCTSSRFLGKFSGWEGGH